MALMEGGNFQWVTRRLLVIVAQLQKTVESLTYVNKSAKTETEAYKIL